MLSVGLLRANDNAVLGNHGLAPKRRPDSTTEWRRLRSVEILDDRSAWFSGSSFGASAEIIGVADV